jgi:hypothetical protein
MHILGHLNAYKHEVITYLTCRVVFVCSQRRRAAKESLKLHSIDTAFRVGATALAAWWAVARATRCQQRTFTTAGHHWRCSRLRRVMGLFTSRCGQEVNDNTEGVTRGGHLWRSGLGCVDSLQGKDSEESKQMNYPCIMYYSQINRSHRAVANHHWEHRLSLLHFHTLLAHARACADVRTHAYRAIWFWKYWREATAIKR